MNTAERFNLGSFINSFCDGGLYVEDCNIHVQRWSGFDNYAIVDLSYSMQPGKICAAYSFASESGKQGDLDVTNWISQNFGDSLKMLLMFCNGLEWVETNYGFETYTLIDGPYNIEISKRDRESKKVFSPFATIPKLKAEPTKWTLPHVFKALLNGQFTGLKCNGKYSDDYAFDDATNYGKCDFSDHAADFVRRIMESPAGWRAYGHDGKVSVSCHSFDCNEFTFAL